MGWSEAQRKRLGVEKNLLEQYFPGRVTWTDPTGNTRVEVQMTTNNNKRYTLKIYVPYDFPNSCPDLVISNPSSALKKRNGSYMNSTSVEDHTWSSRDGHTKICHYVPGDWTAENTLYQVFMKGRIWLEAYEGHLQTGKPLNSYLNEMSVGGRSQAAQPRSSCSVM